MLFSPQTELYDSDDTASRVPGLKRPVEQWQATPQLITPQGHEENHSAVSLFLSLPHTYTGWELTLIPPPPLTVSSVRDFLMNQERFLKHLVSFTLPPQFHLKVKSPFFSPGQSMTKAYLDWLKWFLPHCSDSNILMPRHISSSHLYASYADVCLMWCLKENWSDQCSAGSNSSWIIGPILFHLNLSNPPSGWETARVSLVKWHSTGTWMMYNVPDTS